MEAWSRELEAWRKKFSTTDYTIERRGRREMEQPKVGPKGEGVGTTESNEH